MPSRTFGRSNRMGSFLQLHSLRIEWSNVRGLILGVLSLTLSQFQKFCPYPRSYSLMNMVLRTSSTMVHQLTAKQQCGSANKYLLTVWYSTKFLSVCNANKCFRGMAHTYVSSENHCTALDLWVLEDVLSLELFSKVSQHPPLSCIWILFWEEGREAHR